VATTVDVSMVAGTFVLIEIVFVAAAALAVGARRRERTLALLAAAGGRARDLAGVVLITGVILGAAGVVSGVVLGIAGARVALALFAGLISHDVQRLRIPVLAIFGAAALGFAAAVIAAALPARAVARMNVAAALGGRPLRQTASKRTPLAGVVFIGFGALVVNGGAHAHHTHLVEIGIALTLIGTALCGATLLHLAAGVSARLPAAIRFAARDADRHRRRDAPALGAILAVLATAIALSTLTPALALHTSFGLFPVSRPLPAGETRLEPSVDDAPLATIGNGPAAAAALRNALPGHPVGLLQQTVSSLIDGGAPHIDLLDRSRQPTGLDAYVADPTAMRMLGLSATQVRQLRDGHVVVWSDRPGTGPLPELVVSRKRSDGQTGVLQGLPLNGESTKFGLSTLALMSDDTAHRYGITARRPVVLVDHTSTADQAVALRVFESAIGFPAELGTSGPDLPYGNVKPPWNITDALVRQHRLVVALALLLALGVLAAAIALSTSDARRDVARLTTLGLSPAGHRTFSAARAGLLAGLAGILALPAGLLPAYALLANEPARSFRPDYLTIAIVTLAFPVAVTALAWLTARPIARPQAVSS
jgi:putative ABC transport system permease protein